MNIFCSNTKLHAKQHRAFPALYRDIRDGEVLLMFSPDRGLVVRAGDGRKMLSRLRVVGDVVNVFIGEYDELFDGEVTFANW